VRADFVHLTSLEHLDAEVAPLLCSQTGLSVRLPPARVATRIVHSQSVVRVQLQRIGPFDVVTALGSLHHAPVEVAAMAELSCTPEPVLVPYCAQCHCPLHCTVDVKCDVVQLLRAELAVIQKHMQFGARWIQVDCLALLVSE
jgi:hypothetical protein